MYPGWFLGSLPFSMKLPKNMSIFLSVVVVTLALRLPYVFLLPVLNEDETIVAAAATAITSGGLLYIDAVDHKPPLLFYLYALVFRIFGDNNLLAVQLLGVSWSLLTAYLLYRIVRLLSSRRAAVLAALFYAVFSTNFDPPDMAAANFSFFMILPLTAGALFFLKGEIGKKPKYFFLAGFLVGIGFLFKQPAAANLGAMGIFLLLFSLPRGKTFRRTGLEAARIAAGFLLPIVACLAYFSRQGALRELYLWSWAYGFEYTAQVPFRVGMRRALEMLGELTVPNYIFWFFSLISVFHLKRFKSRKGYWFCWLWGVFSVAGAAAGMRPYGNYYNQVFPAFAVLAGWGRAEFWIGKLLSVKVLMPVRR